MRSLRPDASAPPSARERSSQTPSGRRTADGTYCWLEWNASLDDDEGVIHATARDINRPDRRGAAILGDSDVPVLQMAAGIALTHHERWDGRGYPAGLQGAGIPIEGRIVALADVFDALTHARPYKDEWSVARAMAAIRSERGTHFDPQVIDAFERLGVPSGTPAAERRGARPDREDPPAPPPSRMGSSRPAAVG